MLPRMRKRQSPDPLKSTDLPSWLVTRNGLSDVIDSVPIRSFADLRSILRSERDSRITAGWTCEPIGRVCSFFFCSREGVRHLVGIERQEPRSASEEH